MLFAVTCTDRPGQLQLRLDNRQAHLDWANGEDSPVKMAGPLIGPNGDPVGSLLVVEAEDAEHLHQIMQQDPYAKAELFEEVYTIPFKWTVKAPEGLSG
jgi:uncharacterized protein YciI